MPRLPPGAADITAPLRDADTLGAADRQADYESSRRDFCDLDDDGAVARVADRLLAEGQGPSSGSDRIRPGAREPGPVQARIPDPP